MVISKEEFENCFQKVERILGRVYEVYGNNSKRMMLFGLDILKLILNCWVFPRQTSQTMKFEIILKIRL